jgi:hypothetical protein
VETYQIRNLRHFIPGIHRSPLIAIKQSFIVLTSSFMLLCLGGCGDVWSGHHGSGSVSNSYISKVEHQCGVVYTPPSVKGEPLGFMCGEAASGVHFAVTYTHRPHCSLFATIVAGVGENRTQGCIASTPGRPTGTITCASNNTLTIAARTGPRAQSATLRLSTGKEMTSTILSFNAIDRRHWGGIYFNVLAFGMLARAVLIERDQAGHVLHRLLLTPVGTCKAVKGT